MFKRVREVWTTKSKKQKKSEELGKFRKTNDYSDMEDSVTDYEERVRQEAFMDGFTYAIQVLQDTIVKKTK